MSGRLIHGGVCAALAAAALTAVACTNPLSPTSTEWTFKMGSQCSGRLNSAVSIYVDNTYQGQTTGTLTVSVTPGLHTYNAFTERRLYEWGPNQKEIPSGGLTLTLDC